MKIRLSMGEKKKKGYCRIRKTHIFEFIVLRFVCGDCMEDSRQQELSKTRFCSYKLLLNKMSSMNCKKISIVTKS